MTVDLMSGQIDLGAGSLAGLGPLIQRGAVRPIVVISGTRSEKLPGIPNWADEGFVGPAFQNLQECNMLLGPAGTPKEVVDRLGQLVVESETQSPKVKQVRETLATTEPLMTGEVLHKFIERTWPTYQTMTRELNISIG